VSTPPDRILTIKETAERLACPAEVVAQLVRETTLWGTKMDDGGWGIRESELQRFIEAMRRTKEK
jgi:excisionase family DNA binding protein